VLRRRRRYCCCISVISFYGNGYGNSYCYKYYHYYSGVEFREKGVCSNNTPGSAGDLYCLWGALETFESEPTMILRFIYKCTNTMYAARAYKYILKLYVCANVHTYIVYARQWSYFSRKH
jgi:hypothetical protein